jgi:hypothetical protein
MELIQDIKNFKKAIESTNPVDRPIGLREFPYGSCSDASFLLGSYLRHLGYGEFKHISGRRGKHEDNSWTTHAWLEKDGLAIDITCSQFDEVSEDIIISDSSNWHLSFSRDSSETADVYSRDKCASVALVPFFEYLLDIMQTSNSPK